MNMETCFHNCQQCVRCDTVTQCFEEGKSTVTKILKSGFELPNRVLIFEDISDIIEKATAFMATCYEVKRWVTSNMSQVRGKVWSRMMGRKSNKHLRAGNQLSTQNLQHSILLSSDESQTNALDLGC